MNPSKSLLLNDIFLNAVTNWPTRIALVCQGHSWSYQQLFERALNYANAIHQNIGKSDHECIAIYGTKSLETAAAILGTLLAGYTYMPLDITLPANRLAVTLEIAKPKLLLTTTLNSYLGKQLELLPELKLPQLNTNQLSSVTSKINLADTTDFSPETIAYLLFTSGSTGQPKGVCISHRAVMAGLEMLGEHAPFSQDDQVANQSAFCYDLSVFDLFAAFKVGACVHLLPPEIMKVPKAFIEYVIVNQLNSLYMVSSALEYILKYANIESIKLPFKRILLTGDPISQTLIELMKNNIYPACRILNLYSSVEMPYAYVQPVYIDKPNSDLKAFPWKGSMIDASVEDTGVLTIKGPILFSGYINPETTLKDLVSNPCTSYRTGDWVVMNGDSIQLFGRVDRQVKVMGNRIELDDIEINLESLEPVTEAAVTVDKETNEINAFVVVKDEFLQQANPVLILKQLCAKSLAAIMVPKNIHFLSAMPRTTSGKKDRKILSVEMLKASGE